MRPLWSAGILVASPTPVSWHIRQSARPSSVCGIAVGVGAGGGVGGGAGGAGGGVGAGATPPQAADIGTKISIATITNHAYFFMTCFTSLYYNNTNYTQSKGRLRISQPPLFGI